MASATATSIELGAATALDPASSAPALRARAAAVEQPGGSGSEDDVLVASRLADSTVPDGGYGWVMITGCSIMTWWVSDAPPRSKLLAQCLVF